jgi:hypothetical protein
VETDRTEQSFGERMERLEQGLEVIKERNRRVENDKAWETSGFRKASITIFTYVAACIFLWLVAVPNFLLAAMVPALGYLLSTLSLPSLKRYWIKSRKRL